MFREIGGGIDGRGQGPLKAGNNKINYAAKAEALFEGIVRNEKFIDENGNLLTAGKSGKSLSAFRLIPPGQIMGNNGNNGQSEPFRYFYHPDHLGSTSYITDATGEVYQHLEYFAFGETFVEEQGNTDKLPYKFNGKELDEETGLYYYGARYFDAKTSVWLSVDPLADEYPDVSSYNYTLNNPLNLTDPTGKGPEPPVYKIYVRSFISAATTSDPLGRKFEGDNRSASLREDVTARGRAAISFNTGTGQATVEGKPYANETIMDGFNGVTKKTGKVSYKMNQFSNGSKRVVDLLYSTYNPLTPKSLTPSVDVNSRFVLDYNETKNTLNIAYTIKGDGYPSTEAFIEDQSNNRLFLGANKEQGSPGSKLNGGAEELQFTGNISVGLDENGNFKNVTSGSGENRQTYSIQEWNKKIQNDFD